MPQPPHKPAQRHGTSAPPASAATTAPQPPSNIGSKLLVLVGVLMLAALLYAGATSGARPSVALPPPETDVKAPSPPATATAVFEGRQGFM